MTFARFAILSTALLFMAGASASAEVPQSGIAEIAAAFAELNQLALERRASQTLPALSNPKDAPVLKRFWDAAAILGAPPYRAGDVEPLLAIFDKQQQVFKSYALFAVDPGNANPKAFEDESAQSIAFLLRTHAAILPAIADYFAQLKKEEITDARRQGVRRAQSEMISLIASVAIAMRDGNVTPGNEDALAEALAQSAPEMARGIRFADRERLAATLKTARPHVTPVAAERIDRFIAAMAVKACEGLCAID